MSITGTNLQDLPRIIVGKEICRSDANPNGEPIDCVIAQRINLESSGQADTFGSSVFDGAGEWLELRLLGEWECGPAPFPLTYPFEIFRRRSFGWVGRPRISGKD